MAPVMLLQPLTVPRPLSPDECLAALPAGPGRCLLESGLSQPSLSGGAGAPCPGAARWSFAAAEPWAVLSGAGSHFTLRSHGGSVRSADPFRLLEQALGTGACAPLPAAPPFVGGAAGFVAYDVARLLERLPEQARSELPLPDVYLSFFDLVVAVDHRGGRIWLAGVAPPERERAVRERMRRWQAALLRAAAQPPSAEAGIALPPPATPLQSTFDRAGYQAAVTQVIEHIRAGDVFQVNLAQRFTTQLAPAWGADPGWHLYSRLRVASPAPFSAFVAGPGFAVASSSPERFLCVGNETEPGSGRTVETRPIKGTRPRGQDAWADARLAAELLASPKDQAELVMIVDVERNDLGRVAEVGSVHVPDLRRLESFPNVHHAVATVTARLAPGQGPGALLRGTFPSGSVTGAPKVRAMAIIDGLEPVRRHAYCGSIGYFSYCGRLDLNVAIRTVTVVGRQACFHAGGGVVADSDPDAEYEETLAKARGMAAALGLALPD